MGTDSQLQQDVMAKLKCEPAVRAAQINVNGVKALAVEMKVKLPQSGKRTDADIAESAKNILSWTSPVRADAAKVMVEGGWLTLSGNVEWQDQYQYQRQDAADSLRYIAGATAISNQIGIKPSVSTTVVKSDIEAALKPSAAADAKAISVEVAGSDVNLSGTVHSWAERDLATRSAWGTAGIHNVVDKMNLVC